MMMKLLTTIREPFQRHILNRIKDRSLLIIKLSIAAILIILPSSGRYLSAAENTEKKINITIYNFRMLKPAPGDDDKRIKPRDYGYYSIILPETVSKKLQESDRFIINRGKKTLIGNEPDSLETIKGTYGSEFSSEAEETSSDYLIAGQYEVKDKILYVRIFIYNTILKDLQEVATSGDETGVYLKDTTDTLSENIDEKIKEIIVKEIDRGGKSPFLIPAKPLKYTSIGLDSGYVYLSGKWKDVYNNTVYYSPYITFDLASFLDLSFKFDYFDTDSENKDVITRSSMTLTGASVVLGFKYQPFSNLALYLSGGMGFVRSQITLEPAGPFESSLADEKSTDQAAEIGLGIKLNLSSLFIRTGVLYKQILLEEEPMKLGIIYAGAGIHF